MRMQKEEKIVVVLLLMALGSLATAFWAFSPEESSMADMATSTGQASGEDSRSAHLTIEGKIIKKESTRSGGNLIIGLDSTAMPVFIPASAGAKELAAQLREGGSVRISGTVTEYQGEDELKVSHRSDVQLLGV